MTAQNEKIFNICTKVCTKKRKNKVTEYIHYYIKKENGEMIELPEHVERVEKFLVCQKYCKFSYEGLWGLLDADGNGVIMAKYQGIYEITSGGRFLRMCLNEKKCQIWDTENDEFVCGGMIFADINMSYLSQGIILVKDQKELWRIFDTEAHQILPYAYRKTEDEDKRYLIGWSNSILNFNIFDTVHRQETVKLDSGQVAQCEIKKGFLLIRKLGYWRTENFEVYSMETGSKLFSLKGRFSNTTVMATLKKGKLSYCNLFEEYFRKSQKNTEEEPCQKVNWIFFDKDFVIEISMTYHTESKLLTAVNSQAVDYYGSGSLGKNSVRANDILFDINNELDEAYRRYN